jgi:trigger factor
MATAELISREKNIAQIKVTLDVAEVNQHFQQVYREYSNNLRIPGFRKGKIPHNIIKQRVGAENLSGAVGEVLKEYAADEALEKLALVPRHGHTTWHSDPDPQEGQPLTYELSLPVLPEVKIPDYESFELSIPVLNVTEGMKERFRERLAERYTNFEAIESPAAEGNAVLLDFTTKYADSGENAPFGHNGMAYIIGRDGNLPGWDEKLTGQSGMSSITFDYAMPEDFADARIAGKNLTFSVDIKTVHKVTIPEINEEFIKQHMHLDSLDEFDKYIDMSLERERDAQIEQMKRELTMQKIVEGIEAEITEDMLNDEIDGIVKENDRTLRKYDSSLDQYLKEKDQSLAEYRETLRGAAENKIKYFLAIRTIADKHELRANAQDLERYAYYLMQQEGISPQQFKELLGYPEFVSETTYQIVREKALDFIVSKMKFGTEAVSETAEQPAGEGKPE